MFCFQFKSEHLACAVNQSLADHRITSGPTMRQLLLLESVLVLVLCVHQLTIAYQHQLADYESLRTRRLASQRPTRNNYIGDKFVNNFNRNRMHYNDDHLAPAIYRRHRSGKAYGRRPAVSAAINTEHRIDFVNLDLPYREPIEPQVIEVESRVVPIIFQFKSTSSPIHLIQSHQPAGVPDVKETKSEDEPQIVRHEVTKPIIQELREIIMPYRRIVQEVKPVHEEIHTIVARMIEQAANTSASGDLNKPYYASSSELVPATSASEPEPDTSASELVLDTGAREPVQLYATVYHS